MRLPFISASVGVCSLSLSPSFFFLPLVFVFFFSSPLLFLPGQIMPALNDLLFLHVRRRFAGVLSCAVHIRRRGRRELRYIRTYVHTRGRLFIHISWSLQPTVKEKKNPIYCVERKRVIDYSLLIEHVLLLVSSRWWWWWYTSGHSTRYKYDMQWY